jgi:hypothetical protein
VNEQLSQDEVETAVHPAMFEAINAGDGFITAEAVSDILKRQIPTPRIQMALRALDAKNLLRSRHNALSGSSYELNEQGYRELENRPSGDTTEETPKLPPGFKLTEEIRVVLVRELEDVETRLEVVEASQFDKAQARAYVLAAKALAEAPEPPSATIWELLNRASNIASVAGLFVAVIGLFR